jgi:hypothetical protein
MDCGDQGDSLTVITVHDISAAIGKSVKHMGLKCLFLFLFELLDRNRHFGGNLLAHILVKPKYVLNA